MIPNRHETADHEYPLTVSKVGDVIYLPLDADLVNADWTKRSPDLQEELGLPPTGIKPNIELRAELRKRYGQPSASKLARIRRRMKKPFTPPSG